MAYPPLRGLACLVPDPGLWRAQWAMRLEEYLAVTAARLAEIDVERTLPDLLPRTRARLGAIMGAIEVERGNMERLLGPLRAGLAPLPAPALPGGVPSGGDLPVLKCYENVFRDWAWGEAEAEISRGLVERLAPPERLGRLGLFGAGAGRLAADLHRALGPERTLALDINPVPLLIAAELIGGATLDVYEFPIGPHGAEQVALRRQLRAAPLREGLTFLLADGLRPPFPPGSLDAALTPWFIDAVGADLRLTAAVIGRALRPDGVWLNLGPLRFTGPLSQQITIEELREIVAGSGFEVLAELREPVPYFASPDSGSHRVETVFGFAARKRREPGPVAPPEPALPWAIDPRLPIPVLPELMAHRRTAVLTTGVISMIDGRRSIADLADALGQSWGVDPRALQDQLRAYLIRLLGR